MLKIVDGQICCIVAMVPCTSGTTLYARQKDVGAIGSVWLYTDGNCYTVTDTSSCGTLTTGWTSVSGCDDVSCGGPPAACSTCAGFASSFTVSGFNGAFPGGGPDGTWCSGGYNCCDIGGGSGPIVPAWSGVLTGYGGGSCTWASTPYDIDVNPTSTPPAGCMTAADGSHLLVMVANVSCCYDTVGGVLTPYWILTISWGTEFNGSTVSWVGMKTTGATPIGVYDVWDPSTGFIGGGSVEYPDSCGSYGGSTVINGPTSLTVS